MSAIQSIPRPGRITGIELVSTVMNHQNLAEVHPLNLTVSRGEVMIAIQSMHHLGLIRLRLATHQIAGVRPLNLPEESLS